MSALDLLLECAVKIDGRTARLEVRYCIPDVESDSNTFSCNFSAASDHTEESARADVIAQAKAWANGMRTEGHDISVWDDEGTPY